MANRDATAGVIEVRIRELAQLFNSFDASPFHERDLDDDAENYIVSWARELLDAMRPYTSDASYLNYVGDEGEDRIKASYGRSNYERLVALKQKYDPTNFFRLNQNIAP
mgnify:CR=1 FL=1